eukprot:2616893-Lingulodinium_polyedra.AAC.1
MFLVSRPTDFQTEPGLPFPLGQNACRQPADVRRHTRRAVHVGMDSPMHVMPEAKKPFDGPAR